MENFVAWSITLEVSKKWGANQEILSKREKTAEEMSRLEKEEAEVVEKLLKVKTAAQKKYEDLKESL